jgi:putative intracellular protease/amidase
MNIAIPIFDKLTALDAVGPYEVLSRLPGATVHFVALETGPKRTETEMLALVADRRLDELHDPDVVVVPGGFGTRALMEDEAMLSWLRSAHTTSRWTTSTGSKRRRTGGSSRCWRPTAHRPCQTAGWLSRAR